MKDNCRKPACIFYHIQQTYKGRIRTESVGKCILRKVSDGSIEKFNIYGEWNDNKAMEFRDNLHGCPFIRKEEENRHTNRDVREKCNKCSKRIKWTRQYRQEIEAQRLEDRSF
jgi:hypothetical protein